MSLPSLSVWFVAALIMVLALFIAERREKPKETETPLVNSIICAISGIAAILALWVVALNVIVAGPFPIT